MSLVPLNECCLRLGVDPKTLRLWLKAAQFSCCLHPTDARLKCLTLAQLQQLADLHGRPLPKSQPDTAPQGVAEPASAPATESLLTPPAASDLHQQLSLLRQQVTTLQAQVTELALALLRQSFAHQPPTSAVPVLAPPVPACTSTQTKVRGPARVKASTPSTVKPEPEPTRKRSRALPLIQVRTDGSVVVISPTEGVLPLVPDSPAWFAWFASQTAFSFEGRHGHFSATRKFRHGQRIQSWNVHRSLHGRSCTLYLGLTPALTLARLQEMEALVQARLTAL
jgi:hypothetical protein